jgi:peptidoglycan/xylan/chitin deacetylase (PgdA/CDA1 family)
MLSGRVPVPVIMLFRLIGNIISPAGARARLAILTYHRVLPTADPMLCGEIDAQVFESHMTLLARNFNVLRLTEACERLARHALPSRAVAVTFDDGYANNEEIALPILKRLGIRATFFVSTGFSRGGMMFNDTIIESLRNAHAGNHDLSGIGLGELQLSDIESRRRCADRLIHILMHRPPLERQAAVDATVDALNVRIDRKLMMTPAQIRNLHDEGMEIGAHTVKHPILKSISDDEARMEVEHSKRTLEEITGEPVTSFAYPNGKPGRDYDLRHVQLVKDAGFKAAVSTRPGIACRGSDLFQLPRFGPWERNTHRLGMRLLLDCARALPA